MLCSKLHCQKLFILKLFSYKIRFEEVDEDGNNIPAPPIVLPPVNWRRIRSDFTQPLKLPLLFWTCKPRTLNPEPRNLNI
jgi:hypothetical protein